MAELRPADLLRKPDTTRWEILNQPLDLIPNGDTNKDYGVIRSSMLPRKHKFRYLAGFIR